MNQMRFSFRNLMYISAIAGLYFLTTGTVIAAVTENNENLLTARTAEFDLSTVFPDFILQNDEIIFGSAFTDYLNENLVSGQKPVFSEVKEQYAKRGRRSRGKIVRRSRSSRSRRGGHRSGHRKSYIVQTGKSFLNSSAFEKHLKSTSFGSGGRRKSKIVQTGKSFLNSSSFENYMKANSIR